MENTPAMGENAPPGKNVAVKPPGFWRRQFMPEVSRHQRLFDVAMGILAPTLCLVFDPIIFRDGLCIMDGRGYLGQYRVLAYLAIGLGVLMLSVWFVAGTRIGKWASFVGGVFLAGMLFSLVVGIAILPLSLLSVLVSLGVFVPGIIGIFGFTPFLTAFVYLRNGVRAIQVAARAFEQRKSWLVAGVLAGLMVALGMPALVQWQTDRVVFQAIEQVIEGDSISAQQGERTLRNLGTICPDCYLQYTGQYNISTRNDRLDAIYKDITGKDIPDCTLNWD